MEITLYQVDAFSNQLFKGNPAAVCPLERWVSDEQLQSIAAENNLSETAFFVKNGEGFQLRWFTPTVEVDLCGHATLASAHVLFQHLNYSGQQIGFNSRSGALSVTKENGHYILNFPADTLESIDALGAVEQALGAKPIEIYKGREDYLAIFENQDQIDQLKPNFQAFKPLANRGILASAPGKEVDFVSRCFFPNAGINEDPVTGSAHTTMTPYWAKKLGKSLLTANQRSARGGFLSCELLGDRVALKGQAITYLVGTIFL